jgi:UDP-N-acetylglucosamine:LPS N-acetylglucosamine transferase
VVDQEGAKPFPRRLADTLTQLLEDPGISRDLADHLRQLAHPEAAVQVVDELCRLAGRG